MPRIAIVGAGPAGASAGWHLATRGHEVLLIDRAIFPRPKTCGDWITLGAVAELGRLGLSRELIEGHVAERASIEHTVIVSPKGRKSVCPSRAPAYCIPRHVFDDFLWRHAVAAGCHPMQRTVRDVATSGLLADSEYVIDARGAHAGQANAVALRAYWTVPERILRPLEASTVQIHTDRTFRRGYGWMFPVSRTDGHVRFNVGVGLAAADSKPGHSIQGFYDRFEKTNAVLLGWRHAAVRERAVGCHVGLGIRPNVVSDTDVLRVGDAANLADPMTGDGIGHALASGRLAAIAIDTASSRADAAARWQASADAHFAPEFAIALRLQRLLTSTSAKNLAASLIGVLPPLRTRVHGALFNETSYRALTR